MLVEGLNDKQRQAVEKTQGPLLVLAGAGSGKTRVLTTKIAYILEKQLASKYEILAFTFTNKAAQEMKERVEGLLHEDASSLWIGTFHSICVRILRREISHLGRDRNFTIYDTADQKSLVKEIVRDKGIDTEDFGFYDFMAYVSKLKSQRIPILQIAPQEEEGLYDELFNLYQKKLKEYNALDFDDLIALTVQLFQTQPQVLEEYAQRFKYVFVDEYQDTNQVQYELVRLLASVHRNLCVVGDGDQSIYAWRGANADNIKDFERDFKDQETILLEQNYRSTQRILRAANAVIQNNVDRHDKNLWTENEEGSEILYEEYPSDANEAYGVIQDIMSFLTGDSYRPQDIAILYRTNAQSRTFEEQLMKQNIPYQIIGGLKFYDRKEVKDVLAYLQVLANPKNDIALRRIINTPKRGIGARTLDQLEELAIRQGRSLMEVLEAGKLEGLGGAALTRLGEFADLVAQMRAFEGDSLTDQVQHILEVSGYVASLEASEKREDQTRLENVSAFIDSVADFEKEHPDQASLEDYLESMALMSDLDKEESREGVSLMTVHSAKGLEFDIVFLTGLEAGLFPHMNSETAEEIQEERRLAYVAITRAGQHLTLTSARTRRKFGQVKQTSVSEFLEEMEGLYRDRTRRIDAATNFRESFSESMSFMKNCVQDSVRTQTIEKKDRVSFQVGDKVQHKTFGQGMVVEIKVRDNGDELTIAFDQKGIKKLNSSLAPLERL